MSFTEQDIESFGSYSSREGPKPSKVRTTTTVKPSNHQSYKEVIDFFVAQGYFPPKFYSKEITELEYTSTPLRYETKYNWSTYKYEKIYLSYCDAVGSLPPSSDASAYSLAHEKAVRALYESVGENKVSSLTAVAEATKSIEGILSDATKIFLSLKALYRLDVPGAFTALGLTTTADLKRRRKKARRIKRSIKRKHPEWDGDFRVLQGLSNSQLGKATAFVADTWLSLRYGWMPVLYDVDGALQFLAMPPASDIVRGRGSAAVAHEYYTHNSYVAGYENTFTTRSGRTAVFWTSYFRADPSYPTWNRELGLDLRDIPSTLYELVPGSFILDWFVPIGTYLSNWAATAGLVHLVSCRSYKYDAKETKTTDSGPLLPSNGRHYDDSRSGVGTRFKYERQPFSGFPSQVFPSLDLSDSYNPQRAIDTLALAFGAVNNRTFAKLRI